MSSTKIVAGLIGPVFAGIGLTLVARPGAFAAIAGGLGDQAALMFLSGMVVLAAGVAIVRFHNVWTGWAAIVTVIGWLSVIGGITRMMFAQELADFAVRATENPTFLLGGGAVALALGGFLTFMSYRGAK